MTTESMLIRGRAYQRRATLEVNGETLTWRARRGQLTAVAENIATTSHDIREVTWLEKRWNLGGLGLAALSVVWAVRGDLVLGAITFAIAAALVGWRLVRPRYWFAVDLGPRWLVLRVDAASAPAARQLAARLERGLLTGQVAHAPVALP